MTETADFGTAAVVAPHAAAAGAARDVLIEGGNAIEAAVAAAAVSGVVFQHRHGLGGDATWVIREAGARGRTRALDARGPAAQAATLARYRTQERERIPLHGPDAVLAVPGAVAGWAAALDLSAALGGKLPVSRLLEPAARLAREGFPAPKIAASAVSEVSLVEAPGFAATFLADGKLLQAGVQCRAPLLAETLSYLTHAGLADFYRGDIGREIGRDLERLGSPLARTDLRRFEPRWRDPAALLVAKGKAEAPPTGRGLQALAALGLSERLGVGRRDDVAHRHGVIESWKQARVLLEDAEREGEADAVLTDRVLSAMAERVDWAHASPLSVQPTDEDGTWIGVVDATGLAVSLVHTIGTAFGAGCILPRTGLLMGNRGARFAIDIDDGPLLRPGRRAPMDGIPMLFGFDDGRVLPLGGVGPQGSLVALDIAARMRRGASLADAVAAPRLLPGRPSQEEEPVLLAEDGIDPSVLAALRRAGHPLVEGLDPVSEAGALVHHPAGRIEAAADPRREAEAAGF